ncbi:MAG: hypothetical protein ACC651_02150 [Candidatus Scalindua sp.]
MNRIQAFEFSDQKWLPAFLRRYLRDLLQFHISMDQTYSSILPLLEEIIEKTGVRQINDFCSGYSGPWCYLSKELYKSGKVDLIYLSDLYPDTGALSAKDCNRDYLYYKEEPVDALRSVKTRNGLCTFFTCFHHFNEESAMALLRSAQEQNCAVAIFEFTHRSWGQVVKMLATPIWVWTSIFFIKPFSWKRLFWSCVIPVVPFLYWWDGTISHCRTYNVEELMNLARRIPQREGYKWKTGKKASKDIDGETITYLLGYQTTWK